MKEIQGSISNINILPPNKLKIYIHIEIQNIEEKIPSPIFFFLKLN